MLQMALGDTIRGTLSGGRLESVGAAKAPSEAAGGSGPKWHVQERWAYR
jgi:hypothetical protein